MERIELSIGICTEVPKPTNINEVDKDESPE